MYLKHLVHFRKLVSCQECKAQAICKKNIHRYGSYLLNHCALNHNNNYKFTMFKTQTAGNKNTKITHETHISNANISIQQEVILCM